MKGKKIGLIAILFIVIIAMASVPVEARTIVVAPLTVVGQETGFWLHPGDTVELNYYPYQQGDRMFTTWHADLSYLLKADDPKYGLPIVEFAWKDMANPNDQWHVWKSAMVEYSWPKTKQNLYSGSDTIGYRFLYKTNTENMIYVHAKIQ